MIIFEDSKPTCVSTGLVSDVKGQKERQFTPVHWFTTGYSIYVYIVYSLRGPWKEFSVKCVLERVN